MAAKDQRKALIGFNRARKLFGLKIVASRLKPSVVSSLAGVDLRGRKKGESEVVLLDNGQELRILFHDYPILTHLECPKCHEAYKSLFKPHRNDPDREKLFLCYRCHGLRAVMQVFRQVDSKRPLLREVLRPLERLEDIEDELEVLASRLNERPAERVHELLQEQDRIRAGLRSSQTYSLYRLRLENVSAYIPNPVAKLIKEDARLPVKTDIPRTLHGVQPRVLQEACGSDQAAAPDEIPEAEVSEVPDQHCGSNEEHPVPHKEEALQEEAFQPTAARLGKGQAADAN